MTTVWVADPASVSVTISPNETNLPGPLTETGGKQPNHPVIRIEHTQILTYSEKVEYQQ